MSRMHEYEDSSSDEDTGMLKKALDVTLPDNFDPTIVPQTGEEYLQLVMYEAKHCKKCVSVDIDRNKLKETSIKINMMENCIRAPQNMLPTERWQREKIQDFSNLRKFLETKIAENPSSETIQDSYWTDRIITEIPTFSTINQLSQGSKVRLLQIILDHLDTFKIGESIAYETGIWLYGILATLGEPLCPHACHCLRELARKCSKIRSNLHDTCAEQDYMICNLFICIVAKYFNQLDLAD